MQEARETNSLSIFTGLTKSDLSPVLSNARTCPTLECGQLYLKDYGKCSNFF